MTDREKVIRGLETCNSHADEVGCDQCPYYGTRGELACSSTMLMDALALLREQEPVKPEFDSLDGKVGRWRCGNCHISIGAVRAPYCWHCGGRVKWE